MSELNEWTSWPDVEMGVWMVVNVLSTGVGTLCWLPCRCDTCKLRGYCSSMCAAAHMFEHDCDAAPKPWLSPPVAPKQSAPAELGEEGLFGFIPWSLVRYAYLGAISYVAYHLLEAFLDFKYAALASIRESISLFASCWLCCMCTGCNITATTMRHNPYDSALVIIPLKLRVTIVIQV